MAPRSSRARTLAEFDEGVAAFFMRLALEQAEQGVGRTSPDPAVGAILVKGGRIVGRGFQGRAGGAHAEVLALEAAGELSRGADLYTTLEPCEPADELPGCSLALIDAGVRRVVCASQDPDPKVRGRGLERLRRAGIQVRAGVLAAEADALNGPWLKARRTGLPFVTLKAAVSLDGKLATRTGHSAWVSGEASRAWVHGLRNRVDAILVGANTLRKDDPRLTTRLASGSGRDPTRVVLSSDLALSPRLQVFQLRSPARTLLATTAAAPERRVRALEKVGAEVWQLPARRGQVQLEALLRRLVEEGMHHVLVEGGAEVFASLLRARLADELLLFVAPKLVGGDGLSWLGALGVGEMTDAIPTGELTPERVGEDVLFRVKLSPASGGRRR